MENTIQLNRMVNTKGVELSEHGAIILNEHAPLSLMAKQANARTYINQCPFRRLLNQRWRCYFNNNRIKHTPTKILVRSRFK